MSQPHWVPRAPQPGQNGAFATQLLQKLEVCEGFPSDTRAAGKCPFLKLQARGSGRLLLR